MESNHSEDNRQTPCSSNGIRPLSAASLVSVAEASRFCRQLATSHYENFLVASVFLPRRMRQPFYNIYAYCRYADDLGDESPTTQIATERLLEWREGLRQCFAGHATHPIFIALQVTIRDFDLTVEPFDDLLDAFLQDQVKVRYATFNELLGYCENSANPVGRIVLRLADADTSENVRLSDFICTGLQLANHWQDVARDHQAGRIYLPQEDAQKFNVDLDQIKNDNLYDESRRDAFRSLMQFECERAREFLEKGKPLAACVPRWLANDVRLFVHGGLATLEAIAKQDYDVLHSRPKVSRSRQLRLMLAAALGRLD